MHSSDVSFRVLVRLVPVVLSAALAAPAVSAAAEPELIADLVVAPSPLGVAPEIAGRHGDRVYFTAVDSTRGRSLWRTDGTDAGTEPFFDLCPGPCGLTVTAFASLGDRFVFLTVIEDPSFPGYGTRLWASDGTRAGTVPILHRGPLTDDLVVAGDRAFFVGHDADHGSEIWSTDGTATGTVLHDDVCPGPCSSAPDLLTPFGDRLAFQARTEDEGRELWIAESEPGGAGILLDVCPGACGSVGYIGVHGGLLYFGGVDGLQFGDVWASDGTLAGTRLLIDTPQGTVSSGLFYTFELGDTVYLFRSASLGEPRVWRTDGTPAGTAPADELLPGRPGWRETTFAPPTPGGRLYFQARRPDPDAGISLLRYDAETGAVQELTRALGSASLREPSSGLIGETLVFRGRQTSGDHLWATDGTPFGTRPIDRTTALGFDTSSPTGFTPAGDRLVFTAGETGRRQVWITDGTQDGTRLLPVGNAPSSNPGELTRFGGELAFLAGAEGERALFRHHPAGGPTVVPVAGAGTPADLTAATTGLYYADLDDERRPMVVPAPGAPPVRLAEVPGVRHFAPLPDGRVFFEHWGVGEKLWLTDGTAGGTNLLVDLLPNYVDDCAVSFCEPRFVAERQNFPDRLTPAGDRLYFRAGAAANRDATVWRTDGTAEGTTEIDSLIGGTQWIAPLGEGAIAVVRAGSRNWVYGIGPSGGTQLAIEHDLGRVGEPIPADGLVYYFHEVWSDRLPAQLHLYGTAGTEASTRLLARLDGAPQLAAVSDAVAVGGRLFFTVDTEELGAELWTSDGTAPGTGPVADLWPGPNDSNPSSLTPVGSLLLFGADDGETGHEPWVTDGTAAGTFRLADLHPGPEGSGPSGFARVGDRIYFAADDGEHGRELWAIGVGALAGEEPVEVPDDAVAILAPEYPDFRFWVRITAAGAGGAGGQVQPARRELVCIPETVCVSGALPGRSELFLRIVGPKPNGHLWPTLVRFSTSRIDVWIDQVSTGVLRHYTLDAAAPGSSDLDGLFDRFGFEVD